MSLNRNRVMAVVLYACMAAVMCLVPLSAKATDLPGKGISVQSIGTTSRTSFFQHFIAGIGLQRLGYSVKDHLDSDVAPFYLAIAQGDATFTAMHWTPLYDHYYDKVGGKDKITLLGHTIKGCLQGYLIDKKTADKYNIRKLEQLKDPQLAKLFDTDGDGKANLTGCNPGWGCERVVNGHLDTYGLRQHINHDQGAYHALIPNTIARFKQGLPVLYYTYTPLWVSGVLVPGRDVEWLEVPALPDAGPVSSKLPDGRDLGFPVNEMRVAANKAFIDKNPAARKFFESLVISIDDVNAQNLLMNQGENKLEDVKRHAQEWVTKNKAQFDGWVTQALAAAKK